MHHPTDRIAHNMAFVCMVAVTDAIFRRKGLGREGRKEMFYLTTLNTFYLRLNGIRHMVKDHTDSKKGNLLPSHGLFFPISSKGSFICIISQTG